MHTAAIIILCFAAMPAVGFPLAGFCALLAHDDADLQRIREKVEEARKLGRLETYFTMRHEVSRFSDIAVHWRTRGEARRSVWIGLAFGMVAVIAALLL